MTTDSAEIADRIRVLRNYGSRVKYHNEVVGRNSRLDELQAAMLRVRLPALDAQNQHRAAIAARYLSALHRSGLQLPVVAADASPVWHLFVVRHAQRNALARELAQQGVATVIHYPVAPHCQPAYASLEIAPGRLPLSESMHAQVLSLPIGPTQTEMQTEAVITALRCALGALPPRVG